MRNKPPKPERSPEALKEPAIRDRIKELRRVPACQIVGAPWNWRTHPDIQVERLAASIEELGFFDPLDTRELPDGKLELIDGHARRHLIDRRIGPETLIPCVVTDFTQEEAKLANAIKDPIAAMATANTERLDALLREVQTGHQTVAAMLTEIAQQHGVIPPAMLPTLGTGDPDAVPQPSDAATTQPGDLWLLGKHRLLCGDSSKPKDVDCLLDGAAIHLVNTDPPYNVKVEPRSNNAIAAGLSSFPGTTHHQSLDVARHPEKSQPTSKKLRAKDRPLANDFLSEEEFERLLHAWFGNLARVLLPGRCFYIWGGYANLGNYPPVLKDCGLYFSQGIVWDKEHPVLTRKDFMGCFEIAFYGWRQGAAHPFFGPNNARDLWHIKKVNPQSMIHLTEKPVELARTAMQYSSMPGENVLDLFAGSGSTLIAAEQSGRQAFLMELDPLYCDVIVQRFETFTGHKAQRLSCAAAVQSLDDEEG